ncbi:MAG: hypothetical protein [Olavius algarvensis Delta 4 endosymbiont]|nr:MAG: hypothetical protein [Olavius algarvensis Delta 4 endosymbiont]
MAALQKILVIGVAVLTLTSHTVAAADLVVVTEAWAPYVYEDDEGLKGFDYEVMAAVFKRMGRTIEFRFYPWKRCLSLVRTKMVDAILDIGLTPERSKEMFFPDENISESISVLFFLKGRPDTFDGLSDLTGLRIGTILGYVYSQEVIAAENFTREPVRDIEQNFQKLISGRIDMFISNKNVGWFNAQKLGLLDKVDCTKKKISGGNNYLAFSLKPENEVMATRFSNGLKTFKATSQYRRILKKYGQ